MTDGVLGQIQDALRGTYAIERELGGGGMARVFLAEDLAFGRRVVIKVLSHERGELSLERFKREITLAARLQHANIVPVLTAGEADGTPYYTMPYVDGHSLRAMLTERGALAVSSAVPLLRDVARALAYAHARDVVHRDIKPDNVLVAGGAAVVTDFGIAKALSDARTGAGGAVGARDDVQTLTYVGVVIGTPAYMAPEQAAGDPGLSSPADIYAFGCTAYEMLTGAPPFHGRKFSELVAARAGEEPPISKAPSGPPIPPALSSLVHRCLAKDPAQRPTALEIVAALEGERVSTTTLPTGRARARRWAGVVVTIAVAAAGGLMTTRWMARTEDASTRIAVLPLRNSGDSTADYFAVGLGEELTNAIAKIDRLHVTPPSAIGAADAQSARGPELARRLRVGAFLDGNVQRAGDRLRIVVRLVSGDDGHVQWSGEFDRRVDDVFDLQVSVADSVAAHLRLAFDTPRRERAARAAGTLDFNAFDLYLRGRYAAAQYTAASLREAVTLYTRATELDSSFARAWAGKADAWSTMAGDFVSIDTALVEARAAAQRAVAIDPGLAESHIALGNVLLAGWDARAASTEFTRAVELEPTAATTHYFAASALLTLGRFDEALAEARAAFRLEPAQASYATAVALILMRAGRLDSAVVAARNAVGLDSTFTYGLTVLGDALRQRGAAREALDAYARRGPPQTAYDVVGPALARIALGQRDDGRRSIAEIRALSPRQNAPPDAIAMIHAHLGSADSAFVWLDSALKVRSSALVSLSTDPDWTPLRRDPRLAAFIGRVVPR